MRPARVVLGAISAILLMGLAIGIAQAKPDNPKLKIKSINPQVIKGSVSSNKAACERNRTVVLKVKPPGSRAGAAAKAFKLGTATTNRKGKWKLTGGFSIGTYIAVLKPKSLKARRLSAREDEELDEEELDEDEDDLDAEAAAKVTRCTGTRTKKKEK